MKLAIPSALTWADAHSTWGESNFTFEDCQGSEIYYHIVKLIGKNKRQDILHIESAYKMGCDIFITSDKKDIFSKKLELESICGFKMQLLHY